MQTQTQTQTQPQTPAQPEHYDLLLVGAHLLTADPRQPLLRDACLGVQAGRITWLDTAVPPGGTASRQMNLAGHVVTPGLVNPHTHSVLSMVRGVAADSGFAPSYTPGLPQGTQVNPEQARALARLGALEALLFGTTLLGDHFVQADAGTEAMVDLGLRLAPSWRILDVDFSQVAQGRWVHDPAIGARLLRGAMDLHSRWQGHPRVMVNLAAHAVDTCSNDLLREVAALAAAHGLAVSTHLGQSQIEVQRVQQRTGQTSTEVLDEVGLLNPRLLAGHCIHMTDSDIARFARAGAHVVHIPKCNATSGRMAPTPALQRAGINLALATDTQHADMVELMRWALITARLQEGRVDAQWQPHHVLHMATMGGARALGLDAQIGSLALGKQADLVVFDARRPHWVPLVDPLGNLVHCGQGRDVRHVVVGGELLVEDGQPTRVDMAQVCADAETAARQLWGDAGRRYWDAGSVVGSAAPA